MATERITTLGLMSGTSVDGIDAAIASFDRAGALLEVHATLTVPLAAPLRQTLVDIGQAQQSWPLSTLSTLDHQLGQAFAAAALSVIGQSSLEPADIDAIGHHGQTVFHAPRAHAPNSLQLGDPNIVCHQTGRPVIADLRRADMAAGGQGAPLAPGFHAAQWRSSAHSRAIINIGGIANITVLAADQTQSVIAFDTGPGNGLMDQWILQHHGRPYDEDGQWAAGGTVDAALLDHMRRDPYFALPAPKSTGRDYFNARWLATCLDRFAGLTPEDVQRTLLELTATTIAGQINADVRAAYVCGGGAHNTPLMARLAALRPHVQFADTAALGLDPDAVEAVAFAWLACRHLLGLPGNLPSVTGAARAVRLGAVYQPC